MDGCRHFQRMQKTPAPESDGGGGLTSAQTKNTPTEAGSTPQLEEPKGKQWPWLENDAPQVLGVRAFKNGESALHSPKNVSTQSGLPF